MVSDGEKVDAIIRRLSEAEHISWSEARTVLHRYVCEGKCGWYKTRAEQTGFDRLTLTGRQKRLLEEAVREFMGDIDVEEAKWRIHRVLCPGHPRTPPKAE